VAEESGGLVGDQQFIEINLLGRFAERGLSITCTDTLIAEVEGVVCSCGDLLKCTVVGCLKDEYPARENEKAAGCHFLPKQPTSAIIFPNTKTSQDDFQKQSSPPVVCIIGGVFTDDLRRGLRITLTCIRNLTSRCRKTETRQPVSAKADGFTVTSKLTKFNLRHTLRISRPVVALPLSTLTKSITKIINQFC